MGIKITWENAPLAIVGFIAEGVVLFFFFFVSVQLHVSSFLPIPLLGRQDKR